MANRFADLHFDDRQVARPPLANVIWQVRFASEAKLGDGLVASHFQQLLGRELSLTRVRSEALLRVSVGSGQPPAGIPQVGEEVWRLASEDAKVAVTLAPDFVTFETQAYGSWLQNFRPWIADILNAVNEAMDPGVATRVGLRFVNTVFGSAFAAEPFTTLSGLADFVDDRFLGFEPAGIESTVGMTQSRHVLLVEDLNAAISSALINQEPGAVGILIDIDAYRESTKPFAVDELLEVSDELHDLDLALFQTVLTKDGWAALGPMNERSDS